MFWHAGNSIIPDNCLPGSHVHICEHIYEHNKIFFGTLETRLSQTTVFQAAMFTFVRKKNKLTKIGILHFGPDCVAD